MLALGHMGIGSRLVKPWTLNLPAWPLLLGTLLPDLIDKPLYYILLHTTQFNGVQTGLINSTRTLGHTAIFLILLTAVAVIRRSRMLAAIALGVATHLFLDNLADGLIDTFFPDISHPPQRSALIALLWPVYKPYFAVSPFKTFGDHMHRAINPLSLGFETMGAAILFWDYWQRRHESEIFEALTLRRRQRHELKKNAKKRP